jgi:hypothetical protein
MPEEVVDTVAFLGDLHGHGFVLAGLGNVATGRRMADDN